jgi:hypothetical protein
VRSLKCQVRTGHYRALCLQTSNFKHQTSNFPRSISRRHYQRPPARGVNAICPGTTRGNWLCFAAGAFLRIRRNSLSTNRLSSRRLRASWLCSAQFVHSLATSKVSRFRRNWVCSAALAFPRIRRNSLSTSNLSSLRLRGNWLCSAHFAHSLATSKLSSLRLRPNWVCSAQFVHHDLHAGRHFGGCAPGKPARRDQRAGGHFPVDLVRDPRTHDGQSLPNLRRLQRPPMELFRHGRRRA